MLEKISRISLRWRSYFVFFSIRSSFVFHFHPRNKITLISSTKPRSCECTQIFPSNSFSSPSTSNTIPYQEPRRARRGCTNNSSRRDRTNAAALLMSHIDDALFLLESPDAFDQEGSGGGECSVHSSRTTKAIIMLGKVPTPSNNCFSPA